MVHRSAISDPAVFGSTSSTGASRDPSSVARRFGSSTRWVTRRVVGSITRSASFPNVPSEQRTDVPSSSRIRGRYAMPSALIGRSGRRVSGGEGPWLGWRIARSVGCQRLRCADVLQGRLEGGIEVLAVERVHKAITERELLEAAAELGERQ